MGLADFFTTLANSIRSKTGETGLITPLQMANRINNIVSEPELSIFVDDGTGNFGPDQRVFGLTVSMGAQFTYDYGKEFNNRVRIGNRVLNIARLFDNYCFPAFNQPVDIPDNVINAAQLFYQARNYNSTVNIGNGVTDTSYMFYYCGNYNLPVTIPEKVTTTAYMFASATSFNQPITIPNNVVNMHGMFHSAQNFNQPIVIPNSTTSVLDLFYSARSFNSNVHIGANISNCRNMFWYCNNFNGTVTFANPANIDSIVNMFYCCDNFNQALDSISPTNISNAFYGCTKFNGALNINRVTNAYFAFYNCQNFNQPLIFTNNLLMGPSLAGAAAFNSDITIPETAQYHNSMFVPLYSYSESAYKYPLLERCNINLLSENGSGINMFFNNPTIADTNVRIAAQNCDRMFYCCANFNGNVSFLSNSEYVSLQSAFANCPKFNKPVTIPNGASQLAFMFDNCPSMNQNIVVPAAVTNTLQMVTNCNGAVNKFVIFDGDNYGYVLPDKYRAAVWGSTYGLWFRGNVKNLRNAIGEPQTSRYSSVYGCNGDMVIEDALDSSYMFHNCISAPLFNNCIVNIRSVNTQGMFKNCELLQARDVSIYNVSDASSTFYFARNLNPSSINVQLVSNNGAPVNGSYMFCECQNISSIINVSIPATGINAEEMFGWCNKATHININTPNNIIRLTNGYEMFIACMNINMPLAFDGITNRTSCYMIFGDCYDMRSDIAFGPNISDLRYAFDDKVPLGSNVYVFSDNPDMRWFFPANNTRVNYTNIYVKSPYNCISNYNVFANYFSGGAAYLEFTTIDNYYTNDLYKINVYPIGDLTFESVVESMFN